MSEETNFETRRFQKGRSLSYIKIAGHRESAGYSVRATRTHFKNIFIRSSATIFW